MTPLRPGIPTHSNTAPSHLRTELRRATIDLTERALSNSAKWIAELLNALPRDGDPIPAYRTSTPPRTSTSASFSTSTAGGGTGAGAGAGAGTSRPRARGLGRDSIPGLPPISSMRGGGGYRDSLGSVIEMEASSSPVRPIDEERMEDDAADEHEPFGKARDVEEQDTYLLGLAYFRTHELMRTAFTLEGCKGPKARWLRCYAKFLAGEKRAQEQNGELLGVKDKGCQNPFAQELLDEMDTWEPGVVDGDGYLLYLKSLLLLALPPLSPSPFGTGDGKAPVSDVASSDIRLLAMDALGSAIKLTPYNWSAWIKLAECLEGPEELEAIVKFLPSSFVSVFFYVHASLEIHAGGEGLHEALDELDEIFPQCATISGMRGLIHYHVREFEEATIYFSELKPKHPYRFEDIDTYSNILYVLGKRPELAALAQEYIKIDRARPEVCCLVGNYYSLIQDHEKAIIYFRRALKLDKAYLSAWTLMGHEFVEIKNTNAAIASYRRAVDVNRKDYRAWYGLGQTYELLGEPFYAINYYQKATALRPYDSRMWLALATCYEKLKRIPDAIKSHQRALLAADSDAHARAQKIGDLYAELGNSNASVAYYRRALAEALREGLPKGELYDLYLWLARWEIQREKERGKGKEGEGEGEGDLGIAEQYLKEIVGIPEAKEDAKKLLQEIKMLLFDRD